MVMPMAGRVLAAVAGGLLVLGAWSSVIGTLIVVRPVSGRLTRAVDRAADMAYRLVTRRLPEYRSRDRVLATQAAAILLAQLAAWLGVSYAGYTLLLWPFARRGLASAFVDAGSSMFTLGFAEPGGAAPAALVFDRRDQPRLRRFPRRDRGDAQGRLPHRARLRGGLDRLRRLTGQLRARRLRGRRRGRRPAGLLVRSPSARHAPHRPAPSPVRPAPQLVPCQPTFARRGGDP